ncbi:MAG: AI-2E family transporter [Thermoanaerobaculia bacterium]|nr:AI-2E family transporter [Thermoanaerobaculia bacterium]
MHGDENNTQVPIWREQPIATIFFLAIALVIAWAGIKIILPFLTPILLAAIIVTFTWPVHRRILKKTKGRRNLAATLMLVIVTVTIILPASLLTLLLIQQASGLFLAIQNTDYSDVLQSLRIQERIAYVERVAPWVDIETIQPGKLIVGAVERIPRWVATYGGSLLASLTSIAIGFIFMLLAAFFFYVEGETIVDELRVISPLPDEYETQIVNSFKGVIDATFRGQILTALAQGFVTAIGLAIAGIPAAAFWGAVAAIFSLIPMVGAAAVWVPASIYLFARSAMQDSSILPAIFLVAWGALVVSLVDNLIRPWAMRRGTNMSAILLFFSILGGIRAFGIIGLILGPLVFALFVTMVQMYKYFFTPQLVDPSGTVLATADSGNSDLDENGRDDEQSVNPE